MAQRFYFDLGNERTTIRDDVGSRADDLDDAVEQAQAVVEEMRRSGELASFLGDWWLTIRIADGSVLATIPVSSLLEAEEQRTGYSSRSARLSS
ncbi:DUF6894 family protein [Methylobacterium crusticola]|uniref:DUF6894 family protein n=1 Tax=Methylobacterium crusticola TaxID=1697972 RepID=UPI00193A114F|nr:hypothetical protein [Methylobacterium crusticola]